MNKKTGMRSVVALLIFIGFSGISRADETKAPAPPKWYDQVHVNGLIDAYYSYHHHVQKGLNTYHNFDLQANDLNVSLVELNLTKPVDEKNRAGFYLGLAFGEAADKIACGGACLSQPESSYKNFRQAYARILLLPGLQLDFGKFVTQHGAEVIESKDNWNYTRSLLFAFAIPYYHSGARLTYALNDKISMMANITNGWNNVVENNSGKTYGVQLAVTPVKPFSIVINEMIGSECVDQNNCRTINISDTRSLLDIVANYNVTDYLSLMANYDNGMQKQGWSGGDAVWAGYALYAKLYFAAPFAVGARYELLDDRNGFVVQPGATPGPRGPKLSEETLTLEYSGFGPGSLVRIDLRRDQADSNLFTTDVGPSDHQDTITLGIVQAF